MSTAMREVDSQIIKHIKEKLKQQGIESLSDAEMLCLLLKSGDELKSVSEQADILLRRYESLAGICSAECDELVLRNSGITRDKAISLKLAYELGLRAVKPKASNVRIKGAKDIYELLCAEMAALDRECFRSVMLSAKNEVIGIENISVGSLCASVVHVREVYKSAVKKSAYSIIVVHNHPSGDPYPSGADDSVTVKIAEAGRIMGIKMLDHVIIASGGFYSYAEEGQLIS